MGLYLRTILSLFILTTLFGCRNEQLNLAQIDDSVQSPRIEGKLPSTKILRIGVFGDLNGSLGDPNYDRTVTSGMQLMLNRPIDLFISTGDMTSGEDYKFSLPESRFPEMWRSFEKQILSPILDKNIPFAPSPGNHDASIARERVYYKSFWDSRRPKVQMVSDEMFPFYYSFTFQGVFFIAMDDVLTGKLADRAFNNKTQKEWIKEQLNSQLAQSSVARIVYGHVPLYPVLSKSRHASGNSGKYYEILRQEQLGMSSNSLEGIFKDANVSLVVFGHSHAYYPGVVHHDNEALEDALPVLSMPCLGQGNRYLDQRTSTRSDRGFAEIEIDLSNGKIKYDVTTYAGQLVPKSSLPESIRPYSNVSIKRVDIVEKILNK